MRVVVDTNVFVSAALKERSLPAMAVKRAVQHGTLLKSTRTERQLFDVLSRPYFASMIDPAARRWITTAIADAEMVTIIETIAACRDPTDDKFLELAVSGHADFIISGDADLLVLNSFRSIPILTPAIFAQGVHR